jgi:hypothetical protein
MFRNAGKGIVRESREHLYMESDHGILETDPFEIYNFSFVNHFKNCKSKDSDEVMT